LIFCFFAAGFIAGLLYHSVDSFRHKSLAAKSSPNLFQILRIDNRRARRAGANFFIRV
jgi:hypothetical protein